MPTGAAAKGRARMRAQREEEVARTLSAWSSPESHRGVPAQKLRLTNDPRWSVCCEGQASVAVEAELADSRQHTGAVVVFRFARLFLTARVRYRSPSRNISHWSTSSSSDWRTTCSVASFANRD